MLTLPLRHLSEEIKVDPQVRNTFKNPIIYFSRHPEDPTSSLISFHIVNFLERKIDHYSIFSPENQTRYNNYKNKNRIFISPLHSPHSGFYTSLPGEFLIFNEEAEFFYRINTITKTAEFLTALDFTPLKNNQITKLGATFFVDPEDKNAFYLTGVEATGNHRYQNHFYRVSINLNNFEKIFTHKSGASPPHTTRKYKSVLLNSNFSKISLSLPSLKKTIDREELIQLVFSDLFKQYCSIMGESYTKEKFKTAFKITNAKEGKYELKSDFQLYLEAHHPNFELFTYCQSHKKYKFTVEPGEISTLNLKSKTYTEYATSTAPPAHFEIDEINDDIYVSCHSFGAFGKRFFFGPAVIDKFKLRENKLEKINSFSHPRGYRFTSHKVFHFQEKPLIATIGKANRLFIINADDMSLNHTFSLGKDYIEKIKDHDLTHYVNFVQRGPDTYLGLEVSANGQYIFTVGQDACKIYDLENQRIIHTIPHNDPHFINFTTHCFSLNPSN